MSHKGKRLRFVPCAQTHPGFGCVCVRVKGHEMEFGGHTDGHGLWWGTSLPCGMKHKYRRGVVCTRPRRHRGPHANDVVRWSK